MRSFKIGFVAVLMFVVSACGVATDEGLGVVGTGGVVATGGTVTGTGGTVSTAPPCTASNVGTKWNGYVCSTDTSMTIVQYIWKIETTITSTGGSAVVATGGVIAYDYTPKPTTLCGSNAPWTAPNANSFIGKPSADGKSFIVSTAWPFVGTNCISAPSTATIEAYDLSNDSGQIVDPSPGKGVLFGRAITATNEGYVISAVGLPVGNFHFNLTFNKTHWYYINYAANDPGFPVASRLYVEKSQKASEAGSLGIVFRWDGNTISPAPTFGGNYK